uniref:Uncharacterized protein n=1 Tax=Arundo donax TaxID=35708 RepID=A0A0A9HL10_ARUDO
MTGDSSNVKVRCLFMYVREREPERRRLLCLKITVVILCFPLYELVL